MIGFGLTTSLIGGLHRFWFRRGRGLSVNSTIVGVHSNMYRIDQKESFCASDIVKVVVNAFLSFTQSPSTISVPV